MKDKIAELTREISRELVQVDLENVDLNECLDKIIRQRIRALKEGNWKRKEAHLLIENLINFDFQESIEIYLWDIETAIIGHCDVNSLIRFKDDPRNLNDKELRNYILEEHWK